MESQRTAILVRCTEEDANRIRSAARRERRTLSGYILNAVLNRIESRERALAALEKMQQNSHNSR